MCVCIPGEGVLESIQVRTGGGEGQNLGFLLRTYFKDGSLSD